MKRKCIGSKKMLVQKVLVQILFLLTSLLISTLLSTFSLLILNSILFISTVALIVAQCNINNHGGFSRVDGLTVVTMSNLNQMFASVLTINVIYIQYAALFLLDFSNHYPNISLLTYIIENKLYLLRAI